jgi:hypothetical protein
VPNSPEKEQPNRNIGLTGMKKIAFLSFVHWTASPRSQTQSAADTLLQSIDLAAEAERLGIDGPTSVFITSPDNWHHHSRCSWQSVLKREGLKLAPK